MKLHPILLSLILLSPVMGFMIMFYYAPIFSVVKQAITYSPSTWWENLSHPLVLPFTYFTFTQSIITVILTLLIGLPIGFLLARSDLYGRSILRSAITVPFLFPPLAILVGLIVIFGQNGLILQFFHNFAIQIEISPFSYWGIVYVHVIYNLAVVIRITESALLSEPGEFHDLDKTLGANSWKRFTSITLPYLRPSIEAAALLVFLFSFNSFAIVLVLGQIKLQTIEVMIYQQFKIRLNFERAIILAVYQLLINLIVILIYSSRRYRDQPKIESEITVSSISNRILPTILVIIIILFQWLPIFGIAYSTTLLVGENSNGLVGQIFSNSYNQFLGTSSFRVILNTILISLAVAIISIIFGVLLILASQYPQNPTFIEHTTLPFFLLPMGTSAITLSFSLLLYYGSTSWYSDTIWLFIISAQVIATLPFISRILFSTWKTVPQDLIEISRTLGASKLMTFRQVVFPVMKSALYIAFLFSIAISIGEFGATFFLLRGEWITLSVAIEKLFLSRSSVLPNIYAIFLIGFALILFVIIEKIGNLELKI